MAKKNIITILAIMLLLIGNVFAVETTEVEAGLTPDSPFYFIDRFGEGLSIAFTFNNEDKAVKHLEFAKERLSEMQEVEQIDEIEDLQDNFNKNLEKSMKTSSSEIAKQIENTISKNEEVLNELKDKLPEEAQKGIDNAIKNSVKLNKPYTEEEKKNFIIQNQNMMMEKFLEEFEGKTFEIIFNASNYVVGDSTDWDFGSAKGYKYYKIENKKIKSISSIENPDYTIKINDEQKALDLYNRYEKGDVITYDEVKDVFDVPLRLQGRLVSIVGIGGLK